MPRQRELKTRGRFSDKTGRYETGYTTKSGPGTKDQKKHGTRCGSCLAPFEELGTGHVLRELLDRGWEVNAEELTIRCPDCKGGG